MHSCTSSSNKKMSSLTRRLFFFPPTRSLCKHHPRRQPFAFRYTRTLPQYSFIRQQSTMSDLFVELTAPNGVKYTQPRGLFINNEFVKSKSGETITSINPRYIPIRDSHLMMNTATEHRQRRERDRLGIRS